MPEQQSRPGNQITVAPFEAPFENVIVRFGLQGLNLKDSLDAMEGWSRLTNVDQEEEGEATGRAGQTLLATMSGTIHSIRKLRLPGSTNPGVPGSGEPTIPNYSAIVAATLATFNPTIPEADEEAGKAQLTRAAARAIHATDPKIGLLFKDFGNQINNLSTDIVIQQTDGSNADCASAVNNGNGTVTIRAVWGPHPPDAALISRWREPTDAVVDAEPTPMGPA